VSLLPPNSTQLERALVNISERLTTVPVPIRDVWNPATCPVNLLPWLAWAMGIETWKSYWPENVKREVIKNAVQIKRRKGTVQSVRDTANAFGASVALRENWQLTPAGAPYGFDIAVNVNDSSGQPVTAQFISDIIEEIGRAKPARSFFTVTSGVKASATLQIAASVRPVMLVRLKMSA